MGYARVTAAALQGAEGRLVEVEADVTSGLPGLLLTGLPDAALQQARDRVRAAVLNSGELWPRHRATVNLLPASLPKFGSGFDLPIAIALLSADESLPAHAVDGILLIGELGLDGQIRPVPGVLPAVLAAARAGIARAIVPAGNAREAALVPGIAVSPASTLGGLLSHFREGTRLPAAEPAGDSPAPPAGDLATVAGQETARWGLEIAAAGGHNLAMIGPPGAGKTLLAECMPGLLPELDDASALEVTAVHSIAGLLPEAGLIRRPPYQAPHHTSSPAALVGGGSGLARPGAVTLAHRGVLFLDEAPLFQSGALEALRQPLESGRVQLLRVQGTIEYPARPQLVIAANPCGCAAGPRACECSSLARRRFLGRLSGPLLDRVDIQLTLEPVAAADLLSESVPDSSAEVAARAAKARAAAQARWLEWGWRTNSEVPGRALRAQPWRLPLPVTADLTRHLDLGLLSARGYDRVLRVAWTIADLAGRPSPDREDIAEAIHLRMRNAP
ncbi:YifB family Mg chelatase-like AAA ATPase [Longispora albida]|uniref:YifB family Mg chelatase-like AAA ATPase n=1 Tax=Longispora albida TaxID=203523 RepID=UPI00035EE1FB|nr:YifB family Mg chelatase-like AAA ATPase [Longispora albida]